MTKLEILLFIIIFAMLFYHEWCLRQALTLIKNSVQRELERLREEIK